MNNAAAGEARGGAGEIGIEVDGIPIATHLREPGNVCLWEPPHLLQHVAGAKYARPPLRRRRAAGGGAEGGGANQNAPNHPGR